MRWEHAKHDGIILIGACRAKGLWIAQFQMIGNPATRNGGRLPTSATRDTLLAFGLISALRSINNRIAADVISKRRDGRSKAALLIKSTEAGFTEALSKAIQRQEGPPLRVLRSLHAPLVRQIARFQLSWEVEAHSPPVLAALEWAAGSVLPHADMSDVAPVFLPAAINTREQSTRY